jgi:4-carboxymuconolactone decarboxylase
MHHLETSGITRYQRGLERLCAVEGTSRPSIVDALADIAPDLVTLVIEFAYGDLYGRPALDLPQRQLVTVAALTAMGNARPQLRFHAAGALNVGCSPTELIETLIHLAVYAGFPAALNAIFVLQEVLQERGAMPEPTAVPAVADRYQAGWQALQMVDGHAGERVVAALAGIAPDLGRFIVEFGFGDVYTRPGLSLLQRELVTVAALAAMGTAAPQLAVHLHGVLNVGGSREMVVEVFTHIAAYAGFPAAINAIAVARQVFAERDAMAVLHGGKDGVEA